MRLGLTGGIACGKSEVGAILRREGVAVCDTDDLAREVVRPGQPGHGRIRQLFGETYVDARGEIDRQRLGARVFSDDEARARLNEALHPLIRCAWEAWMEQHRQETVAVMIPLLFEIGATEGWDAILCVCAEPDQVMERLRGRGLSAEEARARLRSQMPLAEKMKRADHVIRNNGTLQDLERETHAVMRLVRETKEGIHHG